MMEFVFSRLFQTVNSTVRTKHALTAHLLLRPVDLTVNHQIHCVCLETTLASVVTTEFLV